MAALLIIVSALVLLFAGYVGYGSWLAKQWGVDVMRKTPAVEMEDGVDYVAAKPVVLMGHHFSSIAGAGPINGPIQAAVFGWVPVFLWCIIGGIFFGGVQDFGSLFASIRNNGKSVGEIIKESMGLKAKKLFIVFAVLVLILVIASFVNIVAATFMTSSSMADAAYSPVQFGFSTGMALTGYQTTAMISLLFVVLAILYGWITTKLRVKTLSATIAGIVGIVVIIMVGLNVGFAMSRTAWIIAIGVYIAIASLAPVWILLQPRDYLSSFLLYGMIALAVVGIAVSAVTGNAHFALPAFVPTKLSSMFPTLFITVACGACSGFHSLIATGTSSKQLDNEKHAKAIGYGSMLIESALGIISLIAVGMVSKNFIIDGAFKGSPSVAFANGIGVMFGVPGSTVYNTVSALLTLAVSVFALTSLDTGTRLSRYMFSELFLKDNEKSWKDASGVRKIFAHPLFGVVIMVVSGCILGGLSLSEIWGLFGAANQLLAGIALMAVAAWLGEIGKNNKMFFIPMIFMLVATLTFLMKTVIAKLQAIAAGAHWGDYFQLIFAAGMTVLAVIIVINGFETFSKQAKKQMKNAT